MNALIKGEQMVKIIVELWPGGRESGRRIIATANIVCIKKGALADYEVDLHEDLLCDVGDAPTLRGYPRWSASVWVWLQGASLLHSIMAMNNCQQGRRFPQSPCTKAM